MAQTFEKCSNCGAPVEVSSDGRSVHCPYCGVGGARGVDPGKLAASLRAEARNAEQLYQGLATRLADEFPDFTRVETSGGLFTSKRVESFEVTLDDAMFRMRRSGRGVVAERSEVVRGIAVKTEPLPIDAWVEALAVALAAKAGSSSRTFDALRRLTTG